MSSSALLLVIAAAIAHASWNLLAKRAAHVGTALSLPTDSVAPLSMHLGYCGF